MLEVAEYIPKTLDEKVVKYAELLDTKARLKEEEKANNEALKALEKEIADQMIDEEKPQIWYDGHNYNLSQKIMYAKLSEEKLQESGLNFMEVLRSEGFGDLIVERVDPRTLQSAMTNFVEEHEQLTEGLASILSVYEEVGVGRRKAANKALKRAKANREDKL